MTHLSVVRYLCSSTLSSYTTKYTRMRLPSSLPRVVCHRKPTSKREAA